MMPPSQPITNKKESSSVLVEGVFPHLVSISDNVIGLRLAPPSQPIKN